MTLAKGRLSSGEGWLGRAELWCSIASCNKSASKARLQPSICVGNECLAERDTAVHMFKATSVMKNGCSTGSAKPGLWRVAARQSQSEYSCHILASDFQAMLKAHRPADRFREDLEQRQVPELELGKSLSSEQRLKTEAP